MADLPREKLPLPATLTALTLNLADAALDNSAAAAVAERVGRMAALERLDLDLRGNPFRGPGSSR